MFTLKITLLALSAVNCFAASLPERKASTTASASTTTPTASSSIEPTHPPAADIPSMLREMAQFDEDMLSAMSAAESHHPLRPFQTDVPQSVNLEALHKDLSTQGVIVDAILASKYPRTATAIDDDDDDDDEVPTATIKPPYPTPNGLDLGKWDVESARKKMRKMQGSLGSLPSRPEPSQGSVVDEEEVAEQVKSFFPFVMHFMQLLQFQNAAAAMINITTNATQVGEEHRI